MPATDRFDVVVSGGGIAGLCAAASFGDAGFSVLCVDPAPPVTDVAAEGADLRTTAFLQPARDMLETVGIWPALAPHATPLSTMRIVDAGGPDGVPRDIRDFRASDISDRPFGWNLPNWLLRRELVGRLAALPGVELRTGVAAAGVHTRLRDVRLRLSDGTSAGARLLIAADGRGSPVREALGIGVRTTRYGQKALAFAVTHALPHRNISTEVHHTGGPFTLVPLPDHQGRPSSAVIWMERGPEAQRLAALDEADFAAEMTWRSGGLYGPLRLASRRSLWPIISQIADRFAGERTALIAEAAHVVPPIGAQGLNMSLADTALLLSLAKSGPAELGSAEMLAAFDKQRRPEVRRRMAGIDLLNRASMAGQPVARDARLRGLAVIHGLRPLRHALMRLGLGAERAASASSPAGY